MARRSRQPRPRSTNPTEDLRTLNARCPACDQAMWSAYTSRRTVSTLGGPRPLRLHVRRCRNRSCPRYHQPYRPEAEGAVALPQHEFGLDVIALAGALRHREHRSVPEVHRALLGRGLSVCERTVTNLLDRYDELLAVRLSDSARLRAITANQGRVVLAIDGLQPDVGHEVLWVLRDCLSGEVLLARSLLSSTEADLAGLIGEVRRALLVPIAGVVSDGQHSIRNAVAKALPSVAHQLCHFHYLREAARPIYEADRHAKKELKKRVRGIRAVERQAEGKGDDDDDDDPASRAVLGYCAAVRSAITDDGRPPLEASGLKLHARLTDVAASLDHVLDAVDEQGGPPKALRKLKGIVGRALAQTAPMWPEVRAGFDLVHRAAGVLADAAGSAAAAVRERYQAVKTEARRLAGDPATTPALRRSLDHFLKVTASYEPGLFHCYDVPGLPRTNNDLEQLFGATRHHERRCTGRKAASPGLVLRGSVRVAAGLGTRVHGRPFTGEDLAPRDPARWRATRAALEQRRKARVLRCRFRRNPAAYLRNLEQSLLKPALPA